MQFTDHQLVSLDRTLRAAHFRVGPAQHADARRVLALLDACDRMPTTPEDLAAYLAPIYCANADQQQRFPDLLKDTLTENGRAPESKPPRKAHVLETNLTRVLCAWLPILVGLFIVGGATAALAYLLWPHTLAGQVFSGGNPVAGAQIQLSQPASTQSTGDDGRFSFTVKWLDWPPSSWFGLETQSREGRPTLSAIKAEHLAAVIPVEGIDHQAHRLELNREPPPPPPPPPPKAPDIEFVYASPPAPAPTPEFRRVQDPPRLLPAQLAIDCLPLVAALGWLAYWILKRRAWLQRLPGNLTQQVKNLSAGARQSLALAIDNAAMAHELRRRHWQPSARLNVDASIRESLRRAGGMKLVFGSRIEPEYLALIDESCASDHLGRLGDALMLSLENRDVLLKRYYFKDNLLLCDGPAAERQPRAPGLPLVPLDVIHGAHSHRRLILISDGKPFFDRLTGQPAPGVGLLLEWPNPTLLTPVPMDDWGRLEWTLSQLGFTVLPLSARGLGILGELAGSEKPVPTAPGQEFDSTTTPRWQSDDIALLLPTPPVGMTPEKFLADLRQSLGEDAYAWLQAVAVYPEIHWGLTLRLGAGLFEDDRRFADALPRLARLIWLRQAYMPNWLRSALTSQLTAADWARIKPLLHAILSCASSGSTGDIPLRIASEPPLPAGLWRRLATFFGRHGQDANPFPGRAGRDTVYLRFLQGPPTLAIPAVEAIKRFFFRDGLWAAGVRAVPAGTLAAAISAVLFWQWWPWIQETRLILAPPAKPALITALAMTGGADDLVLAGYSDGQVRRIARNTASPIENFKDSVAEFAYADTTLAVVRLASGSSRGFPLKSEVKLTAVGNFPFRAVVQKNAGKEDYLVRDAAENFPRRSPATIQVDGIVCAGLTGGARRVVVTGNRIHKFDAQGKTQTSVALAHPAAGCVMRPGADTVFGWNSADVSPVTIWRYEVRAGRLETPLPLAGSDPVSMLSPSRDGRLLWVLQGNKVLALDGTSGQVLATLPVPAGNLAAADDGQTVSVEQNGAVQVWRLTPKAGAADTGRRIFLAITARYPGSGFEQPNTREEVDALRAVLTKRYGYEAIVLQDATKSAVAARMEELAKTLTARDELIIFFNGISQEPDKSGRGLLMLLIYDAKQQNNASQAISSDELANWLASIPATNALTILDTVRAQRARNGKAAERTPSSSRSRWLLSSAGENELAYSSPKSPTSPFSNAIVEALAKATGPITTADLLKATRAVLPTKEFQQTPNLDPMPGAGHTGGDFTLTPVRGEPPQPFPGPPGGTRPLPALNIDVGQTSISGFGGGGFMSVQFQVAHSSIVKGAGVIGGGPFNCSMGEITRAVANCTCSGGHTERCAVTETSADVPSLVASAQEMARQGLIDPLRYVASQRILTISGEKDTLVPPAIAHQLSAFYTALGVPAANVSAVNLPNAGNTMPTLNYGIDCGKQAEPFIGRCEYDAAGQILSWIYGSLKAPGAKPAGKFIEFVQSAYIPSDGASNSKLSASLDTTAWVYVPDSCAKGEKCRVHIALHGCKQGQTYLPLTPPLGGSLYVGTTFVKNTGYDRWADNNNIVILYPQAVSNPLKNPNGCWDWWGYTGTDYATKNAVQIRTLRAMVDAMAAGVNQVEGKK